MFKKLIASLVLLLCCLNSMLSISVSAQSEEAKLNIVTSFYPVYSITKEIVGNRHNVQMIGSSQGIHGFEPSAYDIKGIYEADVFIYHAPMLESWVKNLEVNRGDSDVYMIEGAKGLSLDPVTGLEDMPDIEGLNKESTYDPHTWLDPQEAANEAQYIADALSQIDVANKDYYQANAKTFTDKTKALIDEYQPKFAELKNKTFVTQHTAFYYLAKRFGLKQLGIAGVSNDVEPSSKQIVEVQKFVNDYGVKTIFVEPNVSTKSAQVVADATGAKIVELSPLETDPQNNLPYLENLHNNLEKLYQALKAEEETN